MNITTKEFSDYLYANGYTVPADEMLAVHKIADGEYVFACLNNDAEWDVTKFIKGDYLSMPIAEGLTMVEAIAWIAGYVNGLKA